MNLRLCVCVCIYTPCNWRLFVTDLMHVSSPLLKHAQVGLLLAAPSQPWPEQTNPSVILHAQTATQNHCMVPFRVQYRLDQSIVPFRAQYHLEYGTVQSIVPCIVPFIVWYRLEYGTVQSMVPFRVRYHLDQSTVPFRAQYRLQYSTVQSMVLFRAVVFN